LISFVFILFFYLDIKVSPRHTSALGGAPITGTKIPSKRKLAVNDVSFLFYLLVKLTIFSMVGFP
jgi:hypothetical protein